jgi:hypothetical protein
MGQGRVENRPRLSFFDDIALSVDVDREDVLDRSSEDSHIFSVRFPSGHPAEIDPWEKPRGCSPEPPGAFLLSDAQYSSARMMVSTRVVISGLAGSSDPSLRNWS